MSRVCPRVCIAGTGSGVGKTSLSLGLVRALARRGQRVQTFKVGPDYLDPTYLTLASGRPCYNLDGWMTGHAYVRQLFARATADADVAIIEGVMGLFDGASPSSREGSTAEIAAWLAAPVLLVVNAHGVARSVAAMVKGYAEFDPEVRITGVIANHAGSDRHKRWMMEALGAAGLPPLAGSVPRGALPALPSRHLGLVSADPQNLPETVLDQLADACERHVNLDAVQQLATSTVSLLGNVPSHARSGTAAPYRPEPPSGSAPSESVCSDESETAPCTFVPRSSARPVRIGVARDEAFHFYYPDNLDILRACGASLVEFSPLRDQTLPEGLAGLYIGGGYPEVHAEQLSANVSMLEAIRDFAAAGHGLYAECGGLMYMGRTLQTVDGRIVPMANVLPIETAMLKQRKTLGYVTAVPADGSLLAPAATQAPVALRGHEFHYSEIRKDESASAGWRRACQITRRGQAVVEDEGYCKGAVFASYVHAHFASCPEAAAQFVSRCCALGEHHEE